MKVLFVSYANVGRSQMATAIYDRLTGDESASAGTFVDYPGQRLGARTAASGALASMHEIGVDMGNQVRTQVTEEMLEDFDKVIVMSEPDRTPAWLSVSSKVEIWSVKDPRAKSHDDVKAIRDEIGKRVAKLVKQLGTKNVRLKS
jgi:arsenate reductase